MHKSQMQSPLLESYSALGIVLKWPQLARENMHEVVVQGWSLVLDLRDCEMEL